MAVEIEYKFLLCNDGWREHADAGCYLRQGYIASADRLSVRVRTSAEQAWLNIKHAKRLAVRSEYEYLIPLSDAEEMLATLSTGVLVEKTRYHVEYHGHTWEIDVFHGDNEGLIVAEVELSTEDEVFQRPPWLGADVTQELRYLNQNLARTPYRQWPPADRP